MPTTLTRLRYWDDWTVVDPADLGDGSDVFVQYTPAGAGPRTFIFQQTGPVPVNEWALESYYHPGLIVDNINPEPITKKGSPTHACSFVHRLKGISQWSAVGVPNNALDGLDYQVRQWPEDLGRLALYRSTAAALGDNLQIDAFLGGNFEAGGYVRCRSANDTTGRAAIAWRTPTNKVLWLRLTGDTRDLELASARNGGSVYLTITESGEIRAPSTLTLTEGARSSTLGQILDRLTALES